MSYITPYYFNGYNITSRIFFTLDNINHYTWRLFNISYLKGPFLFLLHTITIDFRISKTYLTIVIRLRLPTTSTLNLPTYFYTRPLILMSIWVYQSISFRLSYFFVLYPTNELNTSTYTLFNLFYVTNL